MNTMTTTSPAERLAAAGRELGAALAYVIAHAAERIGHRIGARYCAYRIKAAQRDIKGYEQALDWARADLHRLPRQIASHEAFIAEQRARQGRHEALR